MNPRGNTCVGEHCLMSPTRSPNAMEPAKMSKGCWTCRDRKIGCDQGVPSCRNCIRASRQCLGYGLRLSWPKENDRRRSLVAKNLAVYRDETTRRLSGKVRFLNTTSWDIGLHNNLIESGHQDQYTNAWTASVPSSPTSLLEGFQVEQQMLLTYYENNLSRTITTVDDNTNGFRHLLIRLALSDATTSSSALLNSIFALSAYQLSGKHQGTSYKVNAINSLAKAMREEPDRNDKLRQISASMLLVLTEVYNSTDSSWVEHLCGAKRIAQCTFLGVGFYDSELSFLIDWMFYHDALAKFSLRHYTQRTWRQRGCETDPHLKSKVEESPTRNIVLGSMGCSLELMDIISRMSDHVLSLNDSNFRTLDHLEILDDFERRLLNLEQVVVFVGVTESAGDQERAAYTAELDRIASLIYLYRVARRMPSDSPAMTHLVEDAMSIFEKTGMSDSTWPLFVIGCEAKLDHHRAVMIDTFQATVESRQFANIHWIRQMVEAAWKQDDLNTTEQDIDGMVRYNSVMSASKVLPSFV